MRTTFVTQRLTPAIFVLFLLVLGTLAISYAQTTQQRPISDAQKAANEKEEQEQRAARDRLLNSRNAHDEMAKRMFMMGQVRDVWNGPVDIYMAGTDMKQPTFADVTFLSVYELPNGLIVYSARDSEKHGIIINPSQIAMTRTVEPISK